jgi:stage III sporulation protein AD
MYVAPVLKAALIGVLSCVGSALCKDAGQSALSVSLEVLGAAAAVYTALPLLELFVHTIGEML